MKQENKVIIGIYITLGLLLCFGLGYAFGRDIGGMDDRKLEQRITELEMTVTQLDCHFEQYGEFKSEIRERTPLQYVACMEGSP